MKGIPESHPLKEVLSKVISQFKKALDELTEENPGFHRSICGKFKNKSHPLKSKDNKSPNEIYYGKVSLNSIYTMDPTLMKVATTDNGVSAATHVIQFVFEKTRHQGNSSGSL